MPQHRHRLGTSNRQEQRTEGRDRPRTFFFSVGEPSGDLHGANLIRELSQRCDVACVGLGGPRMADAGCLLLADLTQYAVMWFSRVVLNLPHFLRLLIRADHYFREERPDAVILIDYPGFNWWVARRAKAHGIPVYYYGTPQLWGWAPWRVRKMRRLVDHILCKLPFEEPWFRERGCTAHYVGHPYFDELATRTWNTDLVAKWRDAPGALVGLLPGSRTQEIELNLPTLLRAARKIADQLPDTRFAVASLNERHAEMARRHATDQGIDVSIHAGKTAEVIEASTCCIACSGSVSLELLYHEKPTVILYGVSPVAYWLQSYVRTARYITLVNLLATSNIARRYDEPTYDPDADDAEPVPFPEYLDYRDRSDDIARRIVGWLRSESDRASVVADLHALKERHGVPGASCRAADYLLSTVESTPPHEIFPRPHTEQSVRSQRHVAG